MNSSVNPYISGVPVKSAEAFYGREDIFRFVQETLAATEQNVVVLFGQRRIGKTSILHQLSHRLSNRFHGVLFDMQGRANQKVSRVLYDLATAIAHSLGIVSPSAASFEDDGRYFLEHFLPSVYAQLAGKRLLLLLDDFDALAEEPSPAKGTAGADLFPILRQLFNDKNHLAFVFVVGQKVEELPSHLQRLLRQVHHKEISFLNRQDAVQLITEPVKGDLKYSTEAIEAILDVTKGHPYFTRVLCSEVFDHAKRMNRKEVTVEDIRTVVNNERMREKLVPLTSQIEQVAIPSKPEEKRRRRLSPALLAGGAVLVILILASIFAARELLPKPETPTPTQIAAVISPTATASPTMTAIPEPSATNTPTIAPTTATSVVAIATETPTATNTPVTPTAAPTSMETSMPTLPPSPIPTPTPTQAPIPKPLGSLNVWDVVINPKDTKEIYLVVGGEGRGIYKTIDGGFSWALIEGRYDTIECLAIDPKDPRILYAGLWEGILKSTDGGANWKAITAPKESGLPLKETVLTLAVVPDNPRAVYAGTGGGVYKSLDQGQTWEARNKESGASIYNIVMTSGDGERAYAAGEGAEIYKTVDGGSSPWEKLACTYCGRGATSLAVHPDNERIVYVGSDDTKISKSTDGGYTWVLLTLSLQYSDLRISALVIDPRNPDVIYAGTGDRDNLANDGIYKSADGGKTWTSISAGLRPDPSERPYSILTIAIDPDDSQTIYAGGFGGLYRSTDGGNSWERL